MALAPGTRLGPYEITGPLGAGGMGEVYRARDGRLQRDVAIKVLPDSFAADPDRLMRFEREAQTLAALNHPHIAQIHGLEESGSPGGPSVRALIMEFVDGEGLDMRIARGPLPVDEALTIARQIADAMEAAHARGIIHRDLKPANVRLTAAGVVKVLDFGLAKALGPESGIQSATGLTDPLANSPTITTPAMTQAGFILGTAAYMAPEQARGKTVDTRADLWAFGCVLYEMLTARRAFDGETITDVLSAVVSKEPDWSLLPAATPPSAHRLLRRCLKKDVRARLQSAGDARIDLDEWLADPADDRAARVPSSSRSTRSQWLRGLSFAAIGAALASSATLMFTREPSAVAAPPVLRFTISLPLSAADAIGAPAVSPDGRHVAIVLREPTGTRRVWVRPLDGTEFRVLAGTDLASNPFWSTDGSELGYFSAGKLMRVDAAGGVTRVITDITKALTGIPGQSVPAEWGEDGTILFGSPSGTYRVAASGGEPVLVAKADPASAPPASPIGQGSPQWLPGNTSFLYATTEGLGIGGALFMRPLAGDPAVRLLPPESATASMVYTPDGLLVSHAKSAYIATIAAHRFDPVRGMIDEQGVVLADDTGAGFGASQTGLLVYRSSRLGADHRFEWVDASGRPAGDAFGVVGLAPFNLSKNDELLAFLEGGSIKLRDLARGVTTTVVIGPNVVEPILSPDGRRVAYGLTGTDRLGIAIRPSAGGPEEVIFTATQGTLPEDWSSDGRFLAAVSSARRGLIIPLEGDRTPTTFADLGAGAGLDEPRFSPDGRWITYNAADSGRQEVYLVPLPFTGERWQLSAAGGVQARWRRDGAVVYYLGLSGELMAVDVKAVSGKPPAIGRPRVLFETGLSASSLMDQYAPSADGSRFLLRRPVEGARETELHVIANWPSLLRERK